MAVGQRRNRRGLLPSVSWQCRSCGSPGRACSGCSGYEGSSLVLPPWSSAAANHLRRGFTEAWPLRPFLKSPCGALGRAWGCPAVHCRTRRPAVRPARQISATGAVTWLGTPYRRSTSCSYCPQYGNGQLAVARESCHPTSTMGRIFQPSGQPPGPGYGHDRRTEVPPPSGIPAGPGGRTCAEPEGHHLRDLA